MTPDVWQQIEVALLRRLQLPAAAKGLSVEDLVSGVLQLPSTWNDTVSDDDNFYTWI